MKKYKIELVTFDNETIRVNVKHIRDLNLNGITLKYSYLSRFKNGFFGDKEYSLSPESLKVLIDFIDSGIYKTSLSTTSSKEFLKHHPTLDSLKKNLADREKLPKMGQ